MENYILQHSGVDIDASANLYYRGNTMFFNPNNRYRYYKSTYFNESNWFNNDDASLHDGLYCLKIDLTVTSQTTTFDVSDIYVDVIGDDGVGIPAEFVIQTENTGSLTKDIVKIYSNVKFSGNIYVGRTSSRGEERQTISISLQSPS